MDFSRRHPHFLTAAESLRTLLTSVQSQATAAVAAGHHLTQAQREALERVAVAAREAQQRLVDEPRPMPFESLLAAMEE